MLCEESGGDREGNILPITYTGGGFEQAVKKLSSGERPRVEIKMWVSTYIWYLAIRLDGNTKAVRIQRQRKGQGLGLRALQH